MKHGLPLTMTEPPPHMDPAGKPQYAGLYELAAPAPAPAPAGLRLYRAYRP